MNLVNKSWTSKYLSFIVWIKITAFKGLFIYESYKQAKIIDLIIKSFKQLINLSRKLFLIGELNTTIILGEIQNYNIEIGKDYWIVCA